MSYLLSKQKKFLIVYIVLFFSLLCFSTSSLSLRIPIFIGAEGFGIQTPGGRSGKVLRVTNLSPDGEGSLRRAISVQGPRIIVFEVGGTIVLKKNIIINNPYLTIAGQTAPSPGILIKGAGISIRTHDVYIRDIRIRVGDEDVGPAFDNRDALYIEDVPREHDVFNVVIDHCSFSWAVDENVSLWYDGIHDVTISNSIISEALNSNKHPKGPHSKGVIIGPGVRNVSFIGNLFAHNRQRNPYLREGTSVVFLNNVVYNYGNVCASFHGSSKTLPTLVSFVGNVFLKGPDSTKIKPLFIEESISKGSKFFVLDNRWDVDSANPWDICDVKTVFDVRVTSPPIWPNSVKILPSSAVLKNVLINAGARPLDRDQVDQRIVKEVEERKGHIISSQYEVGGWPAFQITKRTFYAPTNPNGDDDYDGYTNIEEYLFLMANQVEGSE